MAQINAQGITPRDLAGFRQLLEQRYRNIFGQDFLITDESPQGQIIGIDALALAENDESLVHQANALNIYAATENQLDDLFSLLDIDRITASRSTVVATLTGQAGAAIPRHSRAATLEGDEFRTTEDLIIGADGTVEADMEAVQSGAVPILPNHLVNIVTQVAGWTAVNNAAEGAVGRVRESDRNYRSRYRNIISRTATSSTQALQASLYEAGAERVKIEINATAAAVTRRGIAIPSYTVMCIVQHGEETDAADIAATVLQNKGMGIGVAGDLPMNLRATFTGGAHGTLSAIAALSGTLTLDGVSVPVNLSGASDFAAAAALLQTALRTSSDSRFSGARASYSDGSFVVSFGSDAEFDGAFFEGAVADGLGLSESADAEFTAGRVFEQENVYQSVEETPVKITVPIAIGAGFPSNGRTLIAQNLVDYAAGRWTGGLGQFNTDGFQIGEDVPVERILSPIYAVPGHELTGMLTVTDTADNALPTETPLNRLYTVAANNITLMVTTA